MRKLLFAHGIAAALALSLGAAQAQTTVPAAEAEGARLWFVELSGAPTADGNSRAAVQSEKAAFRKAAADARISYTERRSFDVLFNGFSVAISPSERVKLARLPGVKALYPVEIIQAPIVERSNSGAAPDLATAIKMTGADIAQNTLGLTGAGVKVAVIDTGIDFDHPDLGGTAFPARRRSRAYVSPTVTTSSATPTTPTRAARRTTRCRRPMRSRRLRRPRHARRRHRRRERQGQGRCARRDLRRLPRVRLRGLDRRRHHDRRDGARAGRRHAGAQHEHRLVVPVAAVPDRTGGRPPRQQGHRRRRLDRQQRRRTASTPQALPASARR